MLALLAARASESHDLTCAEAQARYCCGRELLLTNSVLQIEYMDIIYIPLCAVIKICVCVGSCLLSHRDTHVGSIWLDVIV